MSKAFKAMVVKTAKEFMILQSLYDGATPADAGVRFGMTGGQVVTLMDKYRKQHNANTRIHLFKILKMKNIVTFIAFGLLACSNNNDNEEKLRKYKIQLQIDSVMLERNITDITRKDLIDQQKTKQYELLRKTATIRQAGNSEKEY